ncbi:MAG: dinitrogenase iron-molybdenum cofactor biosynthesis protein [Clostridia bacterium]|nr:dinitrogenase iron-molybdenum cofactor biosynthesis protein [Clostridia bacterium]
MRIAIPFENENIFGHFGHADAFKFYEIENNKIVTMKILPTLGSGHGALAGFLSAHDIDTLICGGIGAGAKKALEEVGITIYGGVSGNADIAVHSFMAGKLEYDPEVHCDHHDHGDHDCNNHSCGGNCHSK